MSLHFELWNSLNGIPKKKQIQITKSSEHVRYQEGRTNKALSLLIYSSVYIPISFLSVAVYVLNQKSVWHLPCVSKLNLKIIKYINLIHWNVTVILRNWLTINECVANQGQYCGQYLQSFFFLNISKQMKMQFSNAKAWWENQRAFSAILWTGIAIYPLNQSIAPWITCINWTVSDLFSVPESASIVHYDIYIHNQY